MLSLCCAHCRMHELGMLTSVGRDLSSGCLHTVHSYRQKPLPLRVFMPDSECNALHATATSPFWRVPGRSDPLHQLGCHTVACSVFH